MSSSEKTIVGTVLVLLIYLHIGHGVLRVYFSTCTNPGFSCVTNPNKKLNVTYECPKGVDDVLFYINQFSAPAQTETFKIRNCHNVTLSTRCSGENKPIQTLIVSNIKYLNLQRLNYESMVPPTVVFENIYHISEIPSKTFSQIIKPYHSVGCYIQPTDFQNLFFKNVTIGTVQSNAFVGLEKFKNFSFENVIIQRLESSAIQLNHDLNAGGFEMRNCEVETMGHLAIQTYGKRALFTDNRFGEIASSGINGTMEHFYFTKNFVDTLQPQSFSILATNIFILDNEFLRLKSLALDKLSPGLLQDSGRNFGKLKFVYDFSKNKLNFMDPGSLHPDYAAYENVQTDMMFSRNILQQCSCENIGWIFSPYGQGSQTAQLEPFYEMVTDPGYSNICRISKQATTCEAPVKAMKQMIGCGQCLKNVTLDSLCNKAKGVLATEVPLKNVDVSDEILAESSWIVTPWNYTGSHSDATEVRCGDLCLIGVVIGALWYINN